jgi:hypothetical protein
MSTCTHAPESRLPLLLLSSLLFGCRSCLPAAAAAVARRKQDVLAVQGLTIITISSWGSCLPLCQPLLALPGFRWG